MQRAVIIASNSFGRVTSADLLSDTELAVVATAIRDPEAGMLMARWLL